MIYLLALRSDCLFSRHGDYCVARKWIKTVKLKLKMDTCTEFIDCLLYCGLTIKMLNFHIFNIKS